MGDESTVSKSESESEFNPLLGFPPKFPSDLITSRKKVPSEPESERPMERIGELFEQRDELFRHISDHIEMFTKNKPEEMTPAIQQSVLEFKSFFVGYINYFVDLTFNSKEVIEGRSRESILADALSNARQLWGQLSRAINQRFNPVYSEKLKSADLMAQEMLEQVGALIKGKPIIYFDKSFHISRHPFQTNPLIGVSLDSYEQTGRSSFAHELGHHVFWNNGEMNQHLTRLQAIHVAIANIIFQGGLPTIDPQSPETTQEAIRSLFEQYEIWSGWIEEVFADVFGTLILGPRFVKGLQDIILREWVKNTPEMVIHDGEHPMPALRPYIASETMKVVAERVDTTVRDDLGLLIDQLERRWEQQVWEASLAEDELLRNGEGRALMEYGESRIGSLVTLVGLRSQVSSIVQMVLNQAILEAEDAETKHPMTLLDTIQFWGKHGTDAEKVEMVRLAEELKKDRAVTHQHRAQAGTNVPEDRAKRLSGDDNLFVQFRGFVLQRRETVKKKRAEWEDVLEFDLSLEQGNEKHTTAESDHAHRHKHDQWRIIFV